MGQLTDAPFFLALADAVCDSVGGSDRIALHLRAESSDFVRFNHAAVRQATHVSQCHATLAVISGPRRAEASVSLTGRLDTDIATLRAERSVLLSQLSEVPEDPYLLVPDEVSSSRRHETGSLPSADALITAVTSNSKGLDLVGFYAGGPVVRAFADSRGQRHWHHVERFHFDWCLYQQADRAIKAAYAGARWDDAEFARRMATAVQRFALLATPPRQLHPGAYRAYFTPMAMSELLGTLGWGGFSALARRTGTSSLSGLEQGHARLGSNITMVEDTARGIAPAFTADGFTKPPSITLIEAGRAVDTLNAARSARQYGLPANGANAQESPESLSLGPGLLADSDVLAALDTGLYVSNLWYLNYSDRQACRMTGMTRFACFWVEGGRLVAPLPVMRFDDSFLRMFGEGLVALTDKAELIPHSDTYGERQLGSVTTPGALVRDWRLTL